MAYRVLEVTIQSANDLKRVNMLSRMKVYAVVTFSGDPLTRQCTSPDPYGGRNPSWNATFWFNVPPCASSASGCLHVHLRTERAMGDRDVGEVIIPLSDVLAGVTAADPGPRPQRCASYEVRKLHRCELRGRLNVSFHLGPVVAPQHHGGAVVAYPAAARPPPFYHPAPYANLPPAHTPQAAAGGYAYDYDGVRQHYYPQSSGPINNFPASAYSQAGAGGGYHPPALPSAAPVNNPAAAAAGYSQDAAGYAAAATPTKGNKNKSDDGRVDFGVGLGAGLVSGAIGGMLASDMIAEAAAYSYGYRAGLADGGAAAVYKNSHAPNKVLNRVESNRTTRV